MKVTCVNCKKSYRLSESQLPISGRKVRCSNCGNVWLQIPPNVGLSTDDAQNNNQLIIKQEQASPLEEHYDNSSTKEQKIEQDNSTQEVIVNESAQREKLNYNINGKVFSPPKIITALAMIFLTLFLTGILFQESLPENLQKVYRLLELYSTDGVILDDVKMTYIGEEDSASIKVQGIIINTSSKMRFLPDISLYLQDSSKHYLYKTNVNNKIQSLKPGQKFEFSYSINSVPKTSETLQCKIGNMFELWLH